VTGAKVRRPLVGVLGTQLYYVLAWDEDDARRRVAGPRYSPRDVTVRRPVPRDVDDAMTLDTVAAREWITRVRELREVRTM